MLKQVRHISEGNFYGLRVTNKARKLSLDKEIKTLEACKDVQTHVYRKEEKELIDTLKRLQRSKHDPFGHYEYHDPAKEPMHHGDHEDATSTRENKHSDTGLGTKRRSQSSKLRLPSQDSVHTDVSDVSVIISLSPIASSTIASKHSEGVNLPPVKQAKEAGMDIHRTKAFMSCVICNLPRYHHRREKEYCTCHVDPTRGPHPLHDHHKATHKRRKSDTDHEDFVGFAARRERRRSLEIEDLIHPPRGLKHTHGNNSFHLTQVPHSSKQVHENVHDHASHGTRRPRDNFPTQPINASQKSKETHERRPGNYSQYNSEGRGEAYTSEDETPTRYAVRGTEVQNNYGDGHSYLHGKGKKSRGTSFEETRSRGSSFEEGRSRGNSFEEDHSRMSSFSEGRGKRDSRAQPDHHGSRHRRLSKRNFHEEELHDLYLKLQKMFHGQKRGTLWQRHTEEGDRFHRNQPPVDHAYGTYPTAWHSHKGEAEDEHPGQQTPAFHGLVHPDNIINHHHFLPYEANKQDKRHSGARSSQRHLGIHVHGVDRHGNRQDFFVTPGSSSHIATSFERNHEPDSRTQSMINKLKQLLNFYQQMDNEAPRYPWPSTPKVKFTLEEFQKLRNCRYLRLTKSNLESLAQLETREGKT